REVAFLSRRNFPGTAVAVEGGCPECRRANGKSNLLTRERRASTMAGVMLPATERAMSCTAAVRQNDAHDQEGRGLPLAGGGGRRCGEKDGTIRFWNVRRRTELSQIPGYHGAVHSIAFAPDGRLLASAGDDGRIRLWNVVTERLWRELTGHPASVKSVCFS